MSWTVMRPVGSKILVRLHPKRTHVGAIEIPDDYRKQQESADIIAVGSRAPHDCKPGMIAILGKWNGTQIPAPTNDPGGAYWVLEADHSRPAPHCPDVYLVGELDEGETVDAIMEKTATDMPRRRP